MISARRLLMPGLAAGGLVFLSRAAADSEWLSTLVPPSSDIRALGAPFSFSFWKSRAADADHDSQVVAGLASSLLSGAFGTASARVRDVTEEEDTKERKTRAAQKEADAKLAAQAEDELAAFTEHWTGFAFERERDGLKLMGRPSMRCMLGFCQYPQARAYSFAIYLDPSATDAHGAPALNQLCPVIQRLGTTQPTKPEVFEAINALPGRKMIVLRLARDIDGSHIERGFERSLLKIVALRLHTDNVRHNHSVPLIHRITKTFGKVQRFQRGSEIKFVIDASRVDVSIDGTVLQSIDDGNIASALLAMYLGKSPVSFEGRRTINTAILKEAAKLCPE